MKVTYLGTTVLLFDDGKDQILFDAYITRFSLFKCFVGKVKSNEKLVDKIIEQHNINRLKAIFVSHSHFDHVFDAPCIAHKTGAVIYGSSSTINVGVGENIPPEQLAEFESGQTYSVGDFKITVLSSIHSKPTILSLDLGQKIEKPLSQPCKRVEYKEGGSYDFLVEHCDKKYLIRPSFGYIEGQLDGINADVLFLGTAGFGKEDAATKEKFFAETVDKVKPETVIPLHWDSFFSSLEKPTKGMPKMIEDTNQVMFEVAEYLEKNNVNFLLQLPKTSITI